MSGPRLTVVPPSGGDTIRKSPLSDVIDGIYRANDLLFVVAAVLDDENHFDPEAAHPLWSVLQDVRGKLDKAAQDLDVLREQVQP
jgi:hypothetical protein